MKKLMFSLFLILSACATVKQVSPPTDFTNSKCQQIFKKADQLKADQQLDLISDLFTQHCFHETLALGKHLRVQSRDKFVYLSSEAAELLTPEGTFTEYVLESYERGYLSLLTAMSYLHLGKENEAQIEMRKSLEERNAELYNYGEDPVLTLLYGALWDQFDSSISRPHWKRLSEFPETDEKVREFARQRIQQIDQNPGQLIRWQIEGLGYLPELDWETDFIRREKGPYKVTATSPFPESCHEGQSVLIPTKSWVDKISLRYHSQYHPLVYTKSLLRAPVALGYGIVGVSTGIAVGFGGCSLAGAAGRNGGSGSAEICKVSLEAAGYVIKSSADLVSYTVKPDLRRWKKLPNAFHITPEAHALQAKTCVGSRSLVKTLQLTPSL